MSGMSFQIIEKEGLKSKSIVEIFPYPFRSYISKSRLKLK